MPTDPNPIDTDDDPDELYQELIMDHGRRPRNTGALPQANCHARGHNPLCGDELTLAAFVEAGRVVEVRFVGTGCAISTASASMMTGAVKGKTLDETRLLFEAFHALVTGEPAPALHVELGKLSAFGGVRRFPVRVKCASLAWHTLEAALSADRGHAVSTES